MKKKFVYLALTAIFLMSFFVSIPKASAGPSQTYSNQSYDYQLVDQQPATAVTMDPGETKTFWVELKNTGTETWSNWNNYYDPQNSVSLGTGSIYNKDRQTNGELDYASPFTNAVISENRAVNRFGHFTDGVQTLVIIKSGWNVRIQFDLTAPYKPGVYKEYFTPVVEGITWMKDIGIYWEITVTDQWQNRTTDLYNGQILLKSKIGDTVSIHSDDISSLTYDKSILKYTAPSTYCYNDVNCQTTYDFQIIGSGFTAIEGTDFSASVVADRDYYFFEEGYSQLLLRGFKKGDIMILRAQNWGEPRTYGGGTITSGNKIMLLKHKTLQPISRLGNDGNLVQYRIDEWVYEINEVGKYSTISVPFNWKQDADGNPLVWNVNYIDSYN